MKLQELKELLLIVSGYETGLYSMEKSACIALVVNDFIGGKIMRCNIEDGRHYYNILNNEIIDLSNELLSDYSNGQESIRDNILANVDIRKRYEKLLYNLKQAKRQRDGYKFKLIDENGQEYLSDTPGTLGGNKKLMIYGKLDCPSAKKWLSKGKYSLNRVFFKDEETAILAGFRPCAVCMPEEYKKWKEQEKVKKLEIKE